MWKNISHMKVLILLLTELSKREVFQLIGTLIFIINSTIGREYGISVFSYFN